MAVLDSLILTGHVNTVHLHFCLSQHEFFFKLLHILMIHQTRAHSPFSLLSTHAHNWDRLHTQDTGVYVIPKTLMRRFLSAKSQVFRESGVSLEVLASRYVASFLPQSSQLGSERAGNGGFDAGEGGESVVGGAFLFCFCFFFLVFSRSGDFNIWSLLDRVCHVHCLSAL